MAGLASASALSEVFDQVVLLERDMLPADSEVRIVLATSSPTTVKCLGKTSTASGM